MLYPLDVYTSEHLNVCIKFLYYQQGAKDNWDRRTVAVACPPLLRSGVSRRAELETVNGQPDTKPARHKSGGPAAQRISLDETNIASPHIMEYDFSQLARPRPTP
jgi:hypothetical protein